MCGGRQLALAHSVLADCAFKSWAPPSHVNSLFPYPLNTTCWLYPVRARRFFCSSLVYSRSFVSSLTPTQCSHLSAGEAGRAREEALPPLCPIAVSALSSYDEVLLLITAEQPHEVPCCLPVLDVPGMILWLFYSLNTNITLAPPVPLC